MTLYRMAVLTFNAGRRLVYWPDAVMGVDARGRVLSLGPAPKRLPRGPKVVDRRGLLAIPGLIDAHCHLSQYPAVAKGGLELLPWLWTHIFPLERTFRGEAARPLARHFFAELAAHGTTCAAVYTSIWQDSTQVCFEEAYRSGLRVIMGKVMMDRGSYDKTFSAARRGRSRSRVSLEQSEALCRVWHRRDSDRILYAFTPRFALSASMELMKGAAALARRYDAYVQTHLSENTGEIAEVARVFPGHRDYASVYDAAGLLGPKTILAHCVWLSASERRLLARRSSAVAHCPTSNAFLASGIMDLGSALRSGVPAALGSDVAAGPSLCLFSVMRQALYAQRLAGAHGLFGERFAMRPEDAFFLGTLGGAQALRLDERVGSLEKGKDADMALLDPSAFVAAGNGARSPAELVSQLVYRAERSAVRETYVRGRRVFQSSARR